LTFADLFQVDPVVTKHAYVFLSATPTSDEKNMLAEFIQVRV